MEWQDTALFKDDELCSRVESVITGETLHMFSTKYTLKLVQDKLDSIHDLTDNATVTMALEEVDMVIDGVIKLLDDYFQNLCEPNWWKDLRDPEMVSEYNEQLREKFCKEDNSPIKPDENSNN